MGVDSLGESLQYNNNNIYACVEREDVLELRERIEASRNLNGEDSEQVVNEEEETEYRWDI